MAAQGITHAKLKLKFRQVYQLNLYPKLCVGNLTNFSEKVKPVSRLLLPVVYIIIKEE